MPRPVRSEHPVGTLLREWRGRRRLPQLQLALQAGISTRHLSYIETGRSRPSRNMVLRLAERLDVPMRERNELLLAAGYAPAFRERVLVDPGLAEARGVIERLLAALEPCPGLLVDRHWNVMMANRAAGPLLACVSPDLRRPPVNALRNSLHPDGLASRIVNLAQWRAHVLARLRRQVDATGDPVLVDLLRELRSYAAGEEGPEPHDSGAVVVPLQLDLPSGRLNLLSTTTVFGAPLDVTLSEVALETFFPTDGESTAGLARLADARGADQAAVESVPAVARPVAP